ncbi:MAG: hypothetical protein K0R24_510 [Gammaproteobacteria bacterium]|jgi:hypothetical protein|nr:hypothetical protein [Gammaproteobacteria bacterium]
MPSSILVLDANIIIRAVLGSKVRNFLIAHHKKIDFLKINNNLNHLDFIVIWLTQTMHSIH